MKNEQNAETPVGGRGMVPRDGAGQSVAVARNGLPSKETIAAYTRPEPVKPEQLFYDINQAAFALNMCTKTVRRLIARGKLTTCKVLRKVLIPREQIENFWKATCDKPNFQ
jgi:excisionase family DNA binding protein